MLEIGQSADRQDLWFLVDQEPQSLSVDRGAMLEISQSADRQGLWLLVDQEPEILSVGRRAMLEIGQKPFGLGGMPQVAAAGRAWTGTNVVLVSADAVPASPPLCSFRRCCARFAAAVLVSPPLFSFAGGWRVEGGGCRREGRGGRVEEGG